MRSRCQSSMSWPSTSCFADSIAALSSAQSRTSDFMKCPSRLTTYARKWDIWLTLDRPGALPKLSVTENCRGRGDDEKPYSGASEAVCPIADLKEISLSHPIRPFATLWRFVLIGRRRLGGHQYAQGQKQCWSTKTCCEAADAEAAAWSPRRRYRALRFRIDRLRRRARHHVSAPARRGRTRC